MTCLLSFSIALLLLVGLVAYVKAQNTMQVGEWQTSNISLPVALAGSEAIRNGHYLYIIGGKKADGTPSELVYLLDLEDTENIGVATLLPLPVPLYAHAAISILVESDGYIFVIGGWDGETRRSEVWRSKIGPSGGLEAWESAGGYPFGVALHDAVVVDSKIYVIGGERNGGLENTSSVKVSDVAAGELVWRDIPGLGTGLRRHAATVHGNVIYVAGGYDGSRLRDEIYFYAPDNPNYPLGWNQSAKRLKHPADYHAIFGSGNQLFVIGGRMKVGEDNSLIPSKEVYSITLDDSCIPKSDEYKEHSNLPEARYRFGFAYLTSTFQECTPTAKPVVKSLALIGGLSPTDSGDIVYRNTFYRNQENQPPIAIADERTYQQTFGPSAPIYISVLNNDRDPDDDLLEIIDCGIGGQLGVAGDSCEYMLQSGADEEFNYTYTVSDGFDEASAQITIEIEKVTRSIRIKGRIVGKANGSLTRGDHIEYTTVARNGSLAADNGTFTTQLPSAVTFIQGQHIESYSDTSLSNLAEAPINTNEIIWDLNSIAQGEIDQAIYTVEYTGGLQLSLSGPTYVTTEATATRPTYTATITNNSSSQISGIRFDNIHDAQYRYFDEVSLRPATGHFTSVLNTDIEPGASQSITFQVAVKNATKAFIFDNFSVCETDGGDECKPNGFVTTNTSSLVTRVVTSADVLSTIQTVQGREVIRVNTTICWEPNDCRDDSFTFRNPPIYSFLPFITN